MSGDGMSEWINDGGPAFPRFQRELIFRDSWDREGEKQFVARDGMSLRDWFAGQALVGMCAGHVWPRADDGPEAARRAYLIADAMLQERAK